MTLPEEPLPHEEPFDEEEPERIELERKPYRIQINLRAAIKNPGTLDGMIEGLVSDAVSRGFFFDWSFSGLMDDDEIVPGSDFDKAVKGVDSDDQ